MHRLGHQNAEHRRRRIVGGRRQAHNQASSAPPTPPRPRPIFIDLTTEDGEITEDEDTTGLRLANMSPACPVSSPLQIAAVRADTAVHAVSGLSSGSRPGSTSMFRRIPAMRSAIGMFTDTETRSDSQLETIGDDSDSDGSGILAVFD